MTKFFIETYGCSHNFSDSEQMAGLLQEAKFNPVENIEDSDIIIINTCTVKGPTETAFFKRLDEIKQNNPYKIIIISGCIPQTDPEKLENYTLIGTKALHHIVQVVEEALNDNIVKMLQAGEKPPLNLPKIRKNQIVEIIPISRGCLSACTFCKTKSARGNLDSYTIDEIMEVARRAIMQGVKEIWLTSEDNFCYGFDINTNLPNLLKEIIKIPGFFRVRIGMGNPVHLKKIKDELFLLLNHEKIFKYLCKLEVMMF
jgi:threonylcarbamoyladenosine tRNA methylthiotransferase CDKAL1